MHFILSMIVHRLHNRVNFIQLKERENAHFVFCQRESVLLDAMTLSEIGPSQRGSSVIFVMMAYICEAK